MTLHPDVGIEIPHDIRDELISYAHEGAPQEVCGVLAGVFDDRMSRVSKAYRADNVASLPEMRYEIHPEQQYEIFERIEDSGLEIVGFYHSHPTGPPGPSATDAAQAAWPERSYVIVILGGVGDGSDHGDEAEERNTSDSVPTVGSWRWTGDRFQNETVRIIE